MEPIDLFLFGKGTPSTHCPALAQKHLQRPAWVEGFVQRRTGDGRAAHGVGGEMGGRRSAISSGLWF